MLIRIRYVNANSSLIANLDQADAQMLVPIVLKTSAIVFNTQGQRLANFPECNIYYKSGPHMDDHRRSIHGIIPQT